MSTPMSDREFVAASTFNDARRQLLRLLGSSQRRSGDAIACVEQGRQHVIDQLSNDDVLKSFGEYEMAYRYAEAVLGKDRFIVVRDLLLEGVPMTSLFKLELP